jgi:hypothetical protein
MDREGLSDLQHLPTMRCAKTIKKPIQQFSEPYDDLT